MQIKNIHEFTTSSDTLLAISFMNKSKESKTKSVAEI